MSRLDLCVSIKLPPVTAGHATTLCVAAALCSALTAASTGTARAADWPLRGSIEPTGYIRWDGWQFGVQAGLANLRTDFANSTSSQVAFILRNTIQEAEFAPSSWTTLSPDTTNGAVFGAYLGYNMQWDQLVLGFDVGYNYVSSAQTVARDSISRQFVTSDQFDNSITIDARATMKLVDYATLRWRGGYAIGQFLPYVAIGAAIGRFNYATSVTVHLKGTPIPPAPGIPFDNIDTSSIGKSNAIVGGVAAGLGADWAITPGMFLRAEWQYVAFAPANNTRSNVNTGQLGIGMRF
jgi:opacity protein-like surface antigen